jgi:flagellum-specific ATP synthase
MINIGAYAKGSNPRIDRALKLIQPIRDFLKQPVGERGTIEDSVRRLNGILSQR